MYATPFEEKQELALWQGKNATILPLWEFPEDEDLLFGRGGVVDEAGDYVPLSGIETRIMNRYPFENPVYRDEKVVYCGYLVNHWGHFLVEAVTRLWYALEQDPTVDKYVFFVDKGEERTVKGILPASEHLGQAGAGEHPHHLPGGHRSGDLLPVHEVLLPQISGDL